MNTNKGKLYLTIIFLVTVLSSCLKRNLPDLPVYDVNNISVVGSEYRYVSAAVGDSLYGQPLVAVRTLTVASQVNNDAATVNVQITVPGASGSFTTGERAKVEQSKLWFYFTISTAATMKGVEGTPNPGNPTDATKPLKYEVTAANGAKKVWTVNITSFTK